MTRAGVINCPRAERTDAQILAEISNDKGIVQTSFIRCQLEVQLDIRRHMKAIEDAIGIQKEILEVIQKGK